MKPREGTKIHIAYNFVDGPWGGGNQFLKALRSRFRDLGVYEEKLCDASVLIINSFDLNAPKLTREIIKRKTDKSSVPHVIHRLDGPFGLVRGRFELADWAVKFLNSTVADATVFQTKWVRENLKLKPVFQSREAVIGNAPDESIFYRAEEIPNGNSRVRLIYSSWSNSHNKGFETLQWLDQNLDWSRFEMSFFGNCPVVFHNIKTYGPKGSESLAKELRESDIFISPARNEPSSNAIIEALHCGLPVIAANHGGSPEIVGQGGELFDHDADLPEIIERVAANLGVYRQRIRVQGIDSIAEQYLTLVADVQKRKARKANWPQATLFSLFWLAGPAATIQKILDLLRKLELKSLKFGCSTSIRTQERNRIL